MKAIFRTVKCPYREDWPDLEGFTVGKEYEFFCKGELQRLTQLNVVNDHGDEVRVLGGHFL